MLIVIAITIEKMFIVLILVKYVKILEKYLVGILFINHGTLLDIVFLDFSFF